MLDFTGATADYVWATNEFASSVPRHVFPKEDLRRARLSPDCRESSRGRRGAPAGHRHARSPGRSAPERAIGATVAVWRALRRQGHRRGRRRRRRGDDEPGATDQGRPGVRALVAGCRAVAESLAGSRQHDFPLERAVFLTVLHRLFSGGSDRAADRWRQDYRIESVEGLGLHHLYRAMGWLGEELAEDQQAGATPFAPRCLKDVMEEQLFARRRDLFSTLDLVFMDATSLYFEGAGGQTLGRRGFSKDHRPDLNQMILAVLLDGDGRPVCTEMWPGNTADVSS